MSTRQVTLKLYGIIELYINDYDRKSGLTLELNSFRSIRQILEEKNIPTTIISLLLSGNKIINLDYQVQNGDVIKVFPHMGGG